MRLGLGAHPLEMDVAAGEVKVLAFGPDQLDGVDPFLRIVVACFVIALRDAEHLELVLVPADDDVQPEASLADLVGGTISLAAMMGWNSGACTVPKQVIRLVAASSAVA